MPHSTDISVAETTFAANAVPFRAPLKFGGRIVDGSENLDVTVRVETASGRQAEGKGSMPIGNVWAWPSSKCEPPVTANAMRQLCRVLCESLPGWLAEKERLAHPIDHAMVMHTHLESAAEKVCRDLDILESMPKLAQLVAASPVDAALHDAFGRANEINSYNGLGKEFVRHDLAHYLDDRFAGEFLDQYTLRKPKPRMPLYHLVGAVDPLSPAEVGRPIGDGLPETLGEWIEREHLTHLKIKLNGEDLGWDVDRVVEVERVSLAANRKIGQEQWFYSLDFNEKCASVDYVLEFLAQLESKSPEGFARVQYLEQPTHRDLRSHQDAKMHKAAAIKPVVIDESLVDYESLLLAREMGYSGVALKACKGHTEALLMGAAANKFGMFLCVQDLTCPGASFLHSASLAARIPTIAAIEGNGRQYCPAGNCGWDVRFPSMFTIRDGAVGTNALGGIGLGF